MTQSKYPTRETQHQCIVVLPGTPGNPLGPGNPGSPGGPGKVSQGPKRKVAQSLEQRYDWMKDCSCKNDYFGASDLIQLPSVTVFCFQTFNMFFIVTLADISINLNKNYKQVTKKSCTQVE